GVHRYVGTVIHSLIQQQKVFDLAEVLSSRMRQRTGGRMWMRRGNFVRMGWGLRMTPEDHVRHVKERRAVLADLQSDIEGAKPDPEQAMLPPPQAGDPFFIATDERDPDALRKIAAAQQLVRSSIFFYGHCMSSLSGAIVNMRAGRGADPRTVHLD
ncbi:hypothetical protein EDB85DRAFT_1835765, partial [Lactarius pseudohatsudake]